MCNLFYRCLLLEKLFNLRIICNNIDSIAGKNSTIFSNGFHNEEKSKTVNDLGSSIGLKSSEFFEGHKIKSAKNQTDEAINNFLKVF